MCGFAIRVARGLPDTATKRNSRKLATSRVASPASVLRIRYPAILTASAGTGRVLCCAARCSGPRSTAWTGITYLPRLCVLLRLCIRTHPPSGRLQAPEVGVPGEAGACRVRDHVGPLGVPGVELWLLEQRQRHHVLPQQRVNLVVQARRLRGVE